MSNKSKPLVTVVVPAYNHERYVEQTITSIISQSYGYENIELMVVDDFSTDNTGKILLHLSEKYRFRFFQNTENKGVVLNLNTLVRKAKGKYIAGCASDDYWDHRKIEEQVSCLESLTDEFAVCHTDAFIIDENNKTLYKQEGGREFSGNIFPKILIQNRIVAPSAMYRSKIFSKIGYFDDSLPFEDREMWIRISLNYKFIHINKLLVYRRQHSSNMSRNPDRTLSYITFTSIFEKYKEYYKTYDLVKEYHFLMFKHMSASDFRKSVYHLFKSGILPFRRNSSVAFFNLLIPKYFMLNGLEYRIRHYLKKW